MVLVLPPSISDRPPFILTSIHSRRRGDRSVRTVASHRLRYVTDAHPHRRRHKPPAARGWPDDLEHWCTRENSGSPVLLATIIRHGANVVVKGLFGIYAPDAAKTFLQSLWPRSFESHIGRVDITKLGRSFFPTRRISPTPASIDSPSGISRRPGGAADGRRSRTHARLSR